MKKNYVILLFIFFTVTLFSLNDFIFSKKINYIVRDDSTETEPNDNCGDAGVQTISNGNYYGEITPGTDVDCWAFYANENDEIVITTVGFEYFLDTELWLVACDETTILAHNDDVCPGVYQSTINYTIPAYGKYYFIVGSYANYEGNYGVSISGISQTKAYDSNVTEEPIAVKIVPNPFSISNFKNNIPLNFVIETGRDAPLRLKIYNLKGELITNVSKNSGQKGVNDIYWFGKNKKGKTVSSGIYFFEINCGNESKYGKFLITR